jgi:hypothetical protein
MTTVQTCQGSTDARVLYMALEPAGTTGHTTIKPSRVEAMSGMIVPLFAATHSLRIRQNRARGSGSSVP